MKRKFILMAALLFMFDPHKGRKAMRKLSVHLAVIICMLFFLNSKADAWFFWRSQHKNLSTIESPERFATINSYPVKIIVKFNDKARPDTFKAWLNGKNITDKFKPIENGMRAFVGPEDGLRIRARGKWRISPKRNILKTRIRGLKRQRDNDVRIFRVKAVKDNDLPTITATIDPPPNAVGWNNTNVAVGFNCSDSTSGIATCPEQVTVETEGANQVVSGTAVDKAGNQATISVTLNIDKTPPHLSPIIDPLPNSNGWNNTNVTVNFQCSDMTSGIASCSDPVSADTEGADQQIAGTTIDLAGNETSETVFISLDMTPPVIKITSPEDGLEFIGHVLPYDIEVKGTASDNLSGIAEVTCNDSAASLAGNEFSHFLSLIDGENSIYAAAVDLAGNVSITPNLVVDFYEPEIELAYVDDFQLIWSDYGSNGNFHASFFKPNLPNGFHSFGHYGYPGLFTVPNGYMLAGRELKPGALAEPVSYQRVWDSAALGSELPAAFWKPIPPTGYVCLGLLVTTGVGFLSPPATDEIRCVHEDLTINGKVEGEDYSQSDLWATSGSPAYVPFHSTQIIPKKEWPTATDAIYAGTFNGSSYTSVYQDPDLEFWIDRKYVKQVDLAATDVKPIVERYGPEIWLHPDEIYFPDDPAVVLDGWGSYLTWGVVLNEWDYDNFYSSYVNGVETTANGLITDFQLYVTNHPLYNPVTNPAFKYWISIENIWKVGNLLNAKALVNVLPVDAIFTDIQFWIYYPFNGPGRVEVCPAIAVSCSDHHLTETGRHYGDWEHVSLRILNKDKTLVAVYMSRHDRGQWFSRKYFGLTLQFVVDHPIVHSAKYSHAFYSAVYDKIVYEYNPGVGGGIADLSFWDQTGFGYWFPTYAKYEIVNSGIPGVPVQNKSWMDFTGRWGQYELLKDVLIVPILLGNIPFPYPYESVGSGPFGPSVQNAWKYADPHDWCWAPAIKSP